MKTKILLSALVIMIVSVSLRGQTVIPNGDFEAWTSYGNYSNPTGWDTPNEELMAIPFFGTAVVSKSTDHHGTGSYAARLESKHITLPPLDAPGFMITANFTVDITSMTYTITGGVPINDQPTHLQGFYKYSPKGGDSCIIGIGLFKHVGSVQDSIGHGEFSTKDTVPDWTFFSAWIQYDTVAIPDTMQVFAFSTAQETITPGTVLFVDDLSLDYTVGINPSDPSAGVHIYNDRETRRLLILTDFKTPENTSATLTDMLGRVITLTGEKPMQNGRMPLSYQGISNGIYILRVEHNHQVISRKFYLEQ